MSRGLGDLQQQILSFLCKKTTCGEGVTFETMRWSLYEMMGKPPIAPDAKLPTRWNTSLRRAVTTLSKRGKITIKKRRLENLKECAEQYPGKTLHADKRNLRLELLPLLAEWEIGPRYNLSSNETFHVSKLTDSILRELEIRWLDLETRVRAIYGSIGVNDSDDLLALICKGRSLFRCREPLWDDISNVKESFGSLIYRISDRGLLPADLVADLRNFNSRFIPKQTASTLRLKSFIHEMVNIPNQSGQCQLNYKTLNYLHKHRKTIVERMPGFQKKAPNKIEELVWPYDSPKFEYDPKLVRLIDQTIFQKFSFATIS